MDVKSIILSFEEMPFAATTSVILGAFSLLLFFFFSTKLFSTKKIGRSNELSPPPVVPGLPLLGNLLQLKEKKPHKTFTKWAEKYGPIYTIKTGASTVVVINSADVAKEAMVTRHSSITTRKLPNALKKLTLNKTMVATSDYNDFHRTVKRHIVTNVLGANAQKRHRCHRDTLIENVSNRLHAHVKGNPLMAINFRNVFESELFGLSMKQALGRDVKFIYVEELGTTMSREDIFKDLVLDCMEGALEVDWRDFFPYLRWIPNKSMVNKIESVCSRRQVVMKALVREGKQRIEMGEEKNCFLDYLLTEAKTLDEEQIAMLLWEEIIEAADTTLVATEWAMYQLAKEPKPQERLLRELEKVCGLNKITEENLSQLPYLGVIFHETLRKHSPVSVIPLRYVHEDTQLGGYFISAGTEIAINIHGCNMDKERWENPEEWQPERFLNEKYDPSDLQKTMAFGAGKRACAGSLQAMLISCTAIGRLVQEFEWKLKSGEEENVDIVGLTSRKRDPLHVVLTPRAH